MKIKAPRPLTPGFGFCVLALAMLAWVPLAQAQFFWSPFFQEQPATRPKVRPAKPKPPANDLPPIVPKESSAPPPPDDRPYDAKLLRLAEILGAVHYLRELCGAQEGQLWRDEMKEILKNEGSTAVRRAKLVNSFNDGYRGYRRTYRSCTSSATVAITRFSTEGAQIAMALAKPSHYASHSSSEKPAAPNDSTPAPEGKADEAKKPEETKAEASAGNQVDTKKGEAKKVENGADNAATDANRAHKPEHRRSHQTGPSQPPQSPD
jgi:uncharacterized protein (TIGR02301 family)